MICMEGLEVATVPDKVRQVEGGARLDPWRKAGRSWHICSDTPRQ